MKGDFSRQTFNAHKHHSGVLMQQGRVQIDADWNEQQAISRHRAETAGADVIGANCSVGPKPMLDVVARMARPDILLAAMPNAGLPQSVEGRLLYMASAEYFGKYARRFVKAGVRLLGGCCGTTPDHIRHIRRQVAGLTPARVSVSASEATADLRPHRQVERRASERTRLADLFADPSAFVTSVELTPPKSARLDELIASVQALAAAGIDAVNIPEYARISPRPTPLAIATTSASVRRVLIAKLIRCCTCDALGASLFLSANPASSIASRIRSA